MIESIDILKKLKDLKTKSGLSSHQIAERSGGDLPESTVKRILNGTTLNPSLAAVLMLIRIMGGNPRDFFDDDTRINLDPADPTVIHEARPVCLDDLARDMSVILSPVKYAIFKTIIDLDDTQCLDALRDLTLLVAEENKKAAP